jgi:integrase
MSKSKPKRRSPGEGSVWPYREKNGTERWAIGHPSFGTRRRGPDGEKWHTKKAAQQALVDMRAAVKRGEVIDPSKQALGDYLTEWLAGRRLAPSTMASYRKNIRLHVRPYIGTVPLASLTTAAIDKCYRQLEASGRADHREGEGLSPRTVRYVHTILSSALSSAAESGLIARNPAARAHPPTAKQARAPEMHPWTAAQLSAFLAWSAGNSQLHACWAMLAMTGMRRGELLALRWRDIDLDAGTVSVRRSAGVVRVKGEGARIIEGDTKTGKARVVDLGAVLVALLRAYKAARGTMALQLAHRDALAFGDHEGDHRHPERFSRTFTAELARCARDLGEDAPPAIRLHDLRHTHASLLQFGWRDAGQGRVRAPRSRLRRGHHDRVRARPARQSAGRGRRVRRADRGGGGMISGPQASDWHHQGHPAGYPAPSPADTSCPRGDLNPPRRGVIGIHRHTRKGALTRPYR